MVRRTMVRALAALFASVLLPAVALAQIKVVTTSTDLHDIAHAVGGDKVDAIAIEQGYQDPHFVEAKPSFILKLRNADVVALIGMELEAGWLPLLIDGARNPKIRPGAAGYMDMSRVIAALDVPSGNVDRSQGDVHPLGNPHYWLDPVNGKRIAHLFAQKFSQLDPKNAAAYAANEKTFNAKIDAAASQWAAQLAQIKGKPVVAWHTSWRYFAEYNGMNIVGFMEPKPGVPPSPSHLAGLIATMKQTGAKVIVMEPYYDRKTADLVASRIGGRVLVLPPSVGGVKGIDDYVALMRYDISQLASTLQATTSAVTR